MSEVVTENPIKAAAKAAFPYSMPMLAGFLFLGIAYGIYMKALGFGVWFPVAMAALIYAGSVEFIAAAALVMPFSPFKCCISYADGEWSSDFLCHFHVRKIWCSNWEKTLVFN